MQNLKLLLQCLYFSINPLKTGLFVNLRKKFSSCFNITKPEKGENVQYYAKKREKGRKGASSCQYFRKIKSLLIEETI